MIFPGLFQPREKHVCWASVHSRLLSQRIADVPLGKASHTALCSKWVRVWTS